MDDQQDNSKGAARIRWTTRGLILLAWVAPFFVGLDAGAAGYAAGQLMAVTLFLMFLVWLVFKEDNPTGKARANLAIALVVVLWSGYTSVRAQAEQRQLREAAAKLERQLAEFQQGKAAPAGQAAATAPESSKPSTPLMAMSDESPKLVLVRIMEKYGEVSKRQNALLQALNSKFEALHTENLLSPATLTNAKELNNARVTVQAFRSLVSERRKLFEAMYAENEDIIRNSGLDAKPLQTALEVFASGRARLLKSLGDLETAQLSLMTTASRVHDLCGTSPGACVLASDGRTIQFRTQLHLDEYRTQMAKLQQLVRDEAAAMEAYNGYLQQAQDRNRQNLQNLQR